MVRPNDKMETIIGAFVVAGIVAVMFLSMLLLPVLRSGWLIRRWEGTLLLIGYVTAFIFLL